MAEQDSRYARLDEYLSRRENRDAIHSTANNFIAGWTTHKENKERHQLQKMLISRTDERIRSIPHQAPLDDRDESDERMRTWWYDIMMRENIACRLEDYIQEHYRTLYAFARPFVDGIADKGPEDLISEAYTRALMRLRKLDKPLDDINVIEAWFKTIIRNWGLTLRRKVFGTTGKQASSRTVLPPIFISFELMEEDQESRMDGQNPPAYEVPEEDIFNEEYAEKLASVLKTLKGKKYDTAVLYASGLSCEKIAEEFNENKNTVKSRVHRTMLQLRQKYLEYYPEGKKRLETFIADLPTLEEETKTMLRLRLVECLGYGDIGKQLDPPRKGKEVEMIVVKEMRTLMHRFGQELLSEE